LVLFFLLTSLVSPLSTYSMDFDPNYILSDEEMQDAGALTLNEIQSFLEGYGSFLTMYQAPDIDNRMKKASVIIYEAAQRHRINPKYLLVKLQKEQSLITDKTPTEKALDGATGYGIDESCGWSCGIYLNNKGFGKQVDSAAAIMRWYYDNQGKQAWIKTKSKIYSVDGQDILPQSFATAFLYTYTPHIQGNKNFWTLWQKWFEVTYPNGSLLKTKTSPDVFLVKDGKKRKIANMTALVTRFDPKNIIEVPEAELAKYTVAPDISLPNYSILKQGSQYYLLDGETLRKFASADVFRQIGYNPDEVIEVNSADISGYTIGLAIQANEQNITGRLLQTQEGSLYYVKGNISQYVPHEAIAKSHFPGIIKESTTFANILKYESGDTLLFADGTLVGINDTKKIYVIENGEKRHIPNEKIFAGLGYSWKNIVWVDSSIGILHKNGKQMNMPDTLLRTDVSSDTSNIEVAENTANIPSTKIVHFEENAKMYLTPQDEKKTTGPVINTDIESYVMAEYETGKILASKNADSPRPMASFAKVLTAYELMEQNIQITSPATYVQAKHNSPYDEFRVADGEQIRNRDLLYSLLVSSLNTPALILADQVGGKEKLVQSLNTKVQSLSLANTHFEDVAGTDINTYTTANDYLKIFKKSIQNAEVSRILNLANYMYYESKDLDGYRVHQDSHTNGLKKTAEGYTVLESKTGYLYEAGYNLAMVVERNTDKKKFIIITMGNPNYDTRYEGQDALTHWVLKQF